MSSDVLISNAGVATIQANSVTLTTDTTGNYVATVSTSALTGITGGAAGSEGTAITLGFDYSATLAANPALATGNAVFGTNGLIFEGATADTFEGLLTVTDPTADNTWTLPNVSGTVIRPVISRASPLPVLSPVEPGMAPPSELSTVVPVSIPQPVPEFQPSVPVPGACLLPLGSRRGEPEPLPSPVTVSSGNGAGAIQATAAGTSAQFLVANGSGVPTFVSMSSDVLISNAGVATIQANSVTLTTDTTGNYVATVSTSALTGITGGAAGSEGTAITLGFDYSATLAANPALATGNAVFGTTGLIFEGATADTFEGLLTVTDPTADNTWTLPNVSGTVITTGNLTSITATGTITSGTWNGTAIGAQYGGTGINTSASTGVPTISAGTWSVSATPGSQGELVSRVTPLVISSTLPEPRPFPNSPISLPETSSSAEVSEPPLHMERSSSVPIPLGTMSLPLPPTGD
ncbi:MAG: hypothetical protein IPO02_13945 [Bacteroidetes bacterium]|nr:hypothetical protein [Bacteroidota bacterium]